MDHIGCLHGVSVWHGEATQLLELVHKPDLIFLDPPFNIGAKYPEYNDKKKQFQDQLRRWIQAAIDAEPRSIWLNLPDSLAAEAVMYLKQKDWTLENWCIWHYRFAQCQPYRFLKSKTHALWFSKGNPIVNREFATVPSLRQTLYNDPRATDDRMDFDVWGFEPYWGRVQGNNKERVPEAPNQLPEKYIQRIVGTCSNPRGHVVDPFAGSGTTGVVCRALNRKCTTGDIGRNTAIRVLERIERGSVRC